MRIYEFGKGNHKTIMCLPGNFMTHRQFENIVPMLEKEYHVITVSFDGYDETGETVYTTGEEQANKLADFICENLDGKIDLVYRPYKINENMQILAIKSIENISKNAIHIA